MSDSAWLMLGMKESILIFIALISSNILSLKYIVSGKLKKIDILESRVAKVEEHRWKELNRMADEVNLKLDKLESRTDDIYKVLLSVKRNNSH